MEATVTILKLKPEPTPEEFRRLGAEPPLLLSCGFRVAGGGKRRQDTFWMPHNIWQVVKYAVSEVCSA